MDKEVYVLVLLGYKDENLRMFHLLILLVEYNMGYSMALRIECESVNLLMEEKERKLAMEVATSWLVLRLE